MLFLTPYTKNEKSRASMLERLFSDEAGNVRALGIFPA